MFVAIDLSDQIIEECIKITRSLQETESNLKIVKPENLHITLKFLGEIREDEAVKVSEEISEISSEFNPFTIEFSNVGFFGSIRFPRVIWVGISNGSDSIVKLCNSLENKLSWLSKEGKKTTPHLTLARARNSINSEKLIEAIKNIRDVKLGELDVKVIKLKTSILNPDGPVYSDFRVFELCKS